MDRLDEFVEKQAEDASGDLSFARELWARMRKSELIEETLERAMTRTNKALGVRNEFANLSRNKKKMRGFSEDEKKAIKQVADGDFTDTALRFLGNFSPQSSLMALLGIGGGGVVGGPVGGMAVPLIGMGARSMATKRAGQKAGDLRDLIARGDMAPPPPPIPEELLQLPPPQRLLTYQPPTLPPAAPQLMLPPPATRGGDALRRFRRPGQ